MSLLLLSFLAAPPAMAQAAEAGLAGVVFDGETGLPLAHAAVRAGGVTAHTDPSGAFLLSVSPGSATLTVSTEAGHAGAITDIPAFAGEVAEVLLTVYRDGRPATATIEAAAGPRATEPVDDVVGSLEGVVVDEAGSPLAGARVYVRGSAAEARTGPDGSFRLEVPVGARDLSVLRSGYVARTLDGVAVTEAGGTPLRIEMAEAGMALAEFRVSVPRIEGGEATLLAERQDATEVVDSLSAEQMTRRGDSSAASALQRVTGLTLVGGRYVYVRGLGERYSASLFNGSTLPSPEPGRRVVPLDLFPTAMLESVVIQKTYSPSMPAEFGGGVVRLRTRGVPDEPLLKVRVAGTYQHGTTGASGLGIDRGPTDWLGIGAGARALPDALASATADTPLQLRSNLPGSQGFTAEELETLGEAFPNRWGLDAVTARPDVTASVVGGRGWDVGGDSRIGFIAGTTYRNTWQQLAYTSTTYNLDATTLSPQNDYVFDETTNAVGLSGIVHLAAELGADHTLSLTTTLTRDSESTALEGYGTEQDIGTDTRRQREQWVERQLFVQQAAGEHALPEVGGLEVEWRGALSYASRLEPDRRDILMQPVSGGDGWYLRYQGGGHGIFFSELADRVLDGGLDLRKPWGDTGPDPTGWRGAATVGLQGVGRSRSVDVRRFRYDILSGGDSTDWLNGEPEDIFTADNISNERLRVAEGTLSTDNYAATHDIRGLYAQAETTAPWGTGLLVGARVERSVQEARTFQLFSEDSDPIIGRLATTDLLPAATLTQPLTGDAVERPMQLRLGYGRTLNRPDLRELSPSTYYDPRTLRETVGNPDLQRAVIDNLDARWEWYLSSDESLSVAVFGKRFTDPIELVVEVGAAGRVTAANAASATNNGVELDLRKSLGAGRGSWLDGLYLGANAAFIRSRVDLGAIGGSATSKERPLQGQSPWVTNLALSWEGLDSPVTGSLLYNVAGPRITQVGVNGIPDQIAQPVHQLDAVVGWEFAPGWAARATGRNLLDSPRTETVGDAVALSFREGWRAGVGLSWEPQRSNGRVTTPR